MHQYGVRDVERLLRLPRSIIRSLVASGFVTPARGARNAMLFSFQDLIVLRTAQELSAALVPRRRIVRALKELRRQLPQSMPLSGLRIGAVGDRVVVREGDSRWQADSGQYLLALEVKAQVVASPELHAVEDWYARALELEPGDPEGAIAAYARAVERDPANVDARVNWGSLLHELGRHADAQRVYSEALAAHGDDPVLLFNLGVLLEDMNRKMEAVHAYQKALRLDAGLADAHYNLALLLRELGRPRDAIRHMSQYRKLAG
ncbi:MAG TPA: tetratricopeptide repeat protein [Usitatibacter sp.]|nr:tetratricopeptide repeat protein [Usitatibacter sp.]